jgi:pimeloyl-ACP methyl ester carboxylesterase
MKAAMTRSQSEQLRDALISQNGPLQRIGEVWFEDKVQVYYRYRIPLHFEKATLDMRLVFDESDRIAGMFFVPHSEPPRALESPFEEIDVVVGGDPKGLPGTITLPTGQGPFAAAVLIHGSGPNDRDETIGPNKPFRDLAWGLAGFGIATLRYDKRSFARPGDLAEAGENLTVKEEVIDDALLAMELMRGRADIDPKAIFVVGHSLGGTLAPRIASFEPHPAGVVVLAGSTLPLPEKMLAQTEYISMLDGVLSDGEKAQLDELTESVRIIRAGLEGEPVPGGYHLGAPLAYYRDLEAHDAPAQMAGLALPCLVLQGGRDYQVTLEDYQLPACECSTTWTIFFGRGRDRRLRATTMWPGRCRRRSSSVSLIGFAPGPVVRNDGVVPGEHLLAGEGLGDGLIDEVFEIESVNVGEEFHQ